MIAPAAGADKRRKWRPERGLAPGAPVTLRPLEFGLFPIAGSDPAVANPILQTLGAGRPQVAAA